MRPKACEGFVQRHNQRSVIVSWKPVHIPLEGKGLLGILWSKGGLQVDSVGDSVRQFRADRHELKVPGTCLLDERWNACGRRRVFMSQWIRFEVQRFGGGMTLNMDQKITQPAISNPKRI